MQKVIITKDKLLSKIKINRDNHRKIFEKALEGWKKRVLEELEDAITDAKNNREYRTYFNLPQPTDHTPEYDAVIEQVEWTEEDRIELDFHQFNQFVRDDWGWKSDFIENSACYVADLK